MDVNYVRPLSRSEIESFSIKISKALDQFQMIVHSIFENLGRLFASCLPFMRKPAVEAIKGGPQSALQGSSSALKAISDRTDGVVSEASTPLLRSEAPQRPKVPAPCEKPFKSQKFLEQRAAEESNTALFVFKGIAAFTAVVTHLRSCCTSQMPSVAPFVDSKISSEMPALIKTAATKMWNDTLPYLLIDAPKMPVVISPVTCRAAEAVSNVSTAAISQLPLITAISLGSVLLVGSICAVIFSNYKSVPVSDEKAALGAEDMSDRVEEKIEDGLNVLVPIKASRFEEISLEQMKNVKMADCLKSPYSVFRAVMGGIEIVSLQRFVPRQWLSLIPRCEPQKRAIIDGAKLSTENPAQPKSDDTSSPILQPMLIEPKTVVVIKPIVNHAKVEKKNVRKEEIEPEIQLLELPKEQIEKQIRSLKKKNDLFQSCRILWRLKCIGDNKEFNALAASLMGSDKGHEALASFFEEMDEAFLVLKKKIDRSTAKDPDYIINGIVFESAKALLAAMKATVGKLFREQAAKHFSAIPAGTSSASGSSNQEHHDGKTGQNITNSASLSCLVSEVKEAVEIVEQLFPELEVLTLTEEAIENQLEDLPNDLSDPRVVCQILWRMKCKGDDKGFNGLVNYLISIDQSFVLIAYLKEMKENYEKINDPEMLNILKPKLLEMFGAVKKIFLAEWQDFPKELD